MRPPTGFSLIKATRADRSPKKSLVAKAVPVVFSGSTTPIPSNGGVMIEGEERIILGLSQKQSACSREWALC